MRHFAKVSVNEYTQTHSFNLGGSPGNLAALSNPASEGDAVGGTLQSQPTNVYAVLKRARLQEFIPQNNTNQRFKTLQYGLKRLAKVELNDPGTSKASSEAHNKSYPDELIHLDTKQLSWLRGQSINEPREYLS